MARKNDDNFYRRQQDEANRLAATQNRHLNEIAKLAKSSVEEMRKMRRAFEAFSEAMLGMKIEPFQGAVLSEAARGQVAEFDINGFKETLLKGEAPAGTVESAIQEAIDSGEHPPALDGLDVIDDSDLPACGFCGDNVGLPDCPTHGEVLPPGVTPKMMADHPEFAERVRNSPHYHHANQAASKRAQKERNATLDGALEPEEKP